MNKQTVRHAIIALTLLFAIAATSVTCIPISGLIPDKGMVWADIAVSPNPVGVNQNALINGWIEPMPDIGWLFSDMTVEITKPDGSVDKLGPFNSYGSGTIYATYKPTQVGQYTAVLKWPGGDHTVDQFTLKPLAPLEPYATNIVSRPFKFVVQNDPVTLYQDYPVPGPNDYWERPIPSEYRAWSSTVAGNWIYPGGFGDSWRVDNLGNKQVNPYATAPNTAHVAWVMKPTVGGLVGDGSNDAMSNGAKSIDIIIGGVGYYQQNGLHAIDIRTGEEIWSTPSMTSSITFAQMPEEYISEASDSGAGGSISSTPPRLWVIGGTTFNVYNAYTGALITSYKGPSGFKPDPKVPAVGGARATAVDINRPDGGVLLYQTYSGSLTSNATWITCWNSSAPGDKNQTFASKLVWYAKDIEAESGSGPYLVPGKVVVCARSGNPDMKAYDALTGKLLWEQRYDKIDDPFIIMSEGAIDGKNMRLYYPCSTDERVRAIDLNTGNVLWKSEPRAYPWGSWSAYSAAVAYDKFYINSYDGVYCYDINNGKMLWHFARNTTETPYGVYPFYGRMYVADGKFYTQEYEHSPTQPLYRGQEMFCFDANNGNVLWSFPMQGTGMAGADGMVITTDAYTGNTYGFGKGKTATTVTVSSSVVKAGDSVLIEGTILDQSPAQPGTPCVSKESMSSWMAYLHTPRPQPTNTTGVPVQLNAIGSDGKAISLGTVTSDMNGKFKFLWNQPAQDLYTITASFDGDDSYWSSWESTGLAVTANNAPSTTTSASPSASPSAVPEGAQALPTTSIYVAIAAAIVIIAVAIAALMLRRRK